MSNLKFYLISTATFLSTSLLGFFVGVTVFNEFLRQKFGDPHNEEILAFTIYSMVAGIVSFFIGTFIGFVVIHKISNRWGKYLTFGYHPALKLTFLSFLSFVAILIAFLKINYYFNK